MSDYLGTYASVWPIIDLGDTFQMTDEIRENTGILTIICIATLCAWSSMAKSEDSLKSWFPSRVVVDYIF